MTAILMVFGLSMVSWSTPVTNDAHPDTLVICPAPFQSTLQPWLAHRRSQGHRIAVVDSDRSAHRISKTIREYARNRALKYVLLIGDSNPALLENPRRRSTYLPAHYVKARVNVQFGSEADIATDNPYADLDDDALPDLAIGRLTADSPAELATMIRKILKYEHRSNQGAWKRRINFIAGVGDFGLLADKAIEFAAKQFIVHGIPPEYDTTMTYASWRSPYCPDPRRFRQTVVDRFNEGCLFWVYIGHGQPKHLHPMHAAGHRYPILDLDDVPKMQSTRGLPIAVFLACYTGAFDFPDDCLAEKMLRSERGPVAVLGSSRITMPYAMGVLSHEMLNACFRGQHETLGDLLVEAKRQTLKTVNEDSNDRTRKWLDMLAGILSPTKQALEAERIENLHLFNLLGDPLLRIAPPAKVALDTLERIQAGQTLEIKGHSPTSGQLTLELVYRRDRTLHTPPKRKKFDVGDESLRRYQQVYEETNQQCCTRVQCDVAAGNFQLSLPIPAYAKGACHIRVIVEGAEQTALGASDLFVVPLKTEAPRAMRVGERASASSSRKRD